MHSKVRSALYQSVDILAQGIAVSIFSNKFSLRTAMGKTKYAKASATVPEIPATQVNCVEAMPQVPKASSFMASPKKKANQRTPDASAYICVYKVCSDAMIFKDDNNVCVFPGITEFPYTNRHIPPSKNITHC